jgi:hypothetical protein
MAKQAAEEARAVSTEAAQVGPAEAEAAEARALRGWGRVAAATATATVGVEMSRLERRTPTRL